MLAVIVGGILGTGLRLSLDSALPHESHSFPVSTLLANTTGSLALGLVVGWLWPRAHAWLRAGLGTGLLGSFTTFSAIAVSVVGLTSTNHGALAATYLAVTLILGIAAAWAGLTAGRLLDATAIRRMAHRQPANDPGLERE